MTNPSIRKGDTVVFTGDLSNTVYGVDFIATDTAGVEHAALRSTPAGDRIGCFPICALTLKRRGGC